MADEDSGAKPKEPAWVSKLASLGANAEARRDRDRKLRGSTGAASEGKSLQAWACSCGWTGVVKDLKPDPKSWAPSCPSCGRSDGLSAKG